MFGSKKRDQDYEAAKLVMKVALRGGKVAFALEAAAKIGRSPGHLLMSAEQEQLISALKSRRDKNISGDLSDALNYLDLDEAVADTFTARMLQEAPALIVNVRWGKLGYAYWTQLVDKLFESAGPHYITRALQARDDIPHDEWVRYGERLMQVAINYGEAWALYAGAQMAQKVVGIDQTQHLLEHLMNKKTSTVKELEELKEKVFTQAGRIVTA